VKKPEFLENYQKFQLGELPTEKPHPLTVGLSSVAQSDLPKALDILKKVDSLALHALANNAPQIEELRTQVQSVFENGGRIFLCGCGATGRLSLLIGFLFREKFQTEQVIAFMAGGDVALVHSLEGFEDYPDLGRRHLHELGFGENDLLVASTEGGETPFVIGATEEAARISKHRPYFLYCNPDEILKEKVERSRHLLDNVNINKICLYVGSMALAGSTRMQASTVLQLALGLALIEVDQPVQALLQEFHDLFDQADYQKLAGLIEREQWVYEEGSYVMYIPRHWAISVFTDTTERSPTFSLPTFESDTDKNSRPSWCYILIPSAETAAEAWQALLKREPRALNWLEVDEQTSESYLNSFDFSKNTLESREERIGYKRQFLFEIDYKNDAMLMSLGGVERSWDLQSHRSLFHHTLLKLLLNSHSTLLMGRMGRFESNVMTWVRATNGKLVDRATRYVQTLLVEQGLRPPYLDVVEEIYQWQNDILPTESLVLKVVEEFKKRAEHGS
jgi:N-acetylmuramic acid 6-phosphate etherase